MFNSFRQWKQRGHAIRELTRLSDHELADLGMARCDIVRVVQAGSISTPLRDQRSGFDILGLSRA